MEVPEEEDYNTFPSAPPPSPVKETKLPFLHDIKFIIPKLRSLSSNNNNASNEHNGKRCVKHHSILCTVCKIVQKDKKTLILKQNSIKNTGRRATDPVIREADPLIHTADPETQLSDPLHTDLVCRTSDPEIRVTDPNEVTPKIYIDPLSLNWSNIQSRSDIQTEVPVNIRNLSADTDTICPACGNCICPRGTFSPRAFRQQILNRVRNRPLQEGPVTSRIPSLLELPLIRPVRFNPYRK